MFAERLRQLREEKCLYQKDIAQYLGISTSAYGYYEQGQREPDIETINKLADFFGTTSDYILGRSDQRNPYIPPTAQIAAFHEPGAKYDTPFEIDEYELELINLWRKKNGKEPYKRRSE